MAVRGVSEADSKILAGPGRAIERVPAGVTAFIGRTLKGPVASPVRIQGFAAFTQVFGGLWQPSPLSYAVEQFFDNGGREAVIVRAANGAHCATLTLPAGADALRLVAVNPDRANTCAPPSTTTASRPPTASISSCNGWRSQAPSRFGSRKSSATFPLNRAARATSPMSCRHRSWRG